MDYIEEALGEKVRRRPWSPSGRIPLYLKKLYHIDHVTIGSQECLILSPKEELGTVAAIKKDFRQLRQKWSGPLAFELPRLTRQRKKTFIAEKIPFIVPGKQLFLPFWGALLQERCDSEQIPAADKLRPSAQMLLFYFIYGKNKPLYLSRIPEKFGFSGMTASRAGVQLLETGLFAARNEGLRKVLTSELSPKELFEKTRPFLLNPVRKRFYINSAELPGGLFIAGESALSRKSALGEPSVPVYGTAKARKFASRSEKLSGGENQCQVEFWRYDPTVLSGESSADALSLVLSLTSQDERVEMFAEEMLAGVWA
ncbi:MAG: hypothetical protein LBK56_09690 [Gracilibacteraceae bacterium]|nr:hypothetical protein [Gracilibacteraceae bacterium]